MNWFHLNASKKPHVLLFSYGFGCLVFKRGNLVVRQIHNPLHKGVDTLNRWLFLWNTNYLKFSGWVERRFIYYCSSFMCSLSWQEGGLCPLFTPRYSPWGRLLHCDGEQVVPDQIGSQSFSRSIVHLLAAGV